MQYGMQELTAIDSVLVVPMTSVSCKITIVSFLSRAEVGRVDKYVDLELSPKTTTLVGSADFGCFVGVGCVFLCAAALVDCAVVVVGC